MPGPEHDRELDIRGEVCPYTLVKSLIVLGEMAPGQVLRIIVDYLPALSNVPKSLKTYGHQVIRVTPLNEKDWQIVIRRAREFIEPAAGELPCTAK
jgi:tRNA 2-thiouridine synthesizing protein A